MRNIGWCARITERLPKILKILTRNTESTVDGLGALITCILTSYFMVIAVYDHFPISHILISHSWFYKYQSLHYVCVLSAYW